MPSDAYTHMEEAWNLVEHPFPAEAINSGTTPYCPTLFSDETQELRRKFIRGSISGNLNVGFLWSQGKTADTGFGKTTLMREATKEINLDFGTQTLKKAGVRENRLVPIVAAYSNLNNLNASGLYPVLFNAVLSLSSRSTPNHVSALARVRDRLIDRVGSQDSDHIMAHIKDSWLDICGNAPPLRMDVLDAFVNGGAQGFRRALGDVSLTARLRNGIHFLDIAVAILAAAGINHLYLMIDQLEDLATNRSINAAKRSREIGRIRDMLEEAPYVGRVHFIFTFHNRAAQVLERFWAENRLPPFEVSDSNTSAVVVLRGIENDAQVADLLRVYLKEHREGIVEYDLLPFESNAITVLREVSDGRVGVLLNRARELFAYAAENKALRITGEFASRFFSDTLQLQKEIDIRDGSYASDDDIDDLLLGVPRR